MEQDEKFNEKILFLMRLFWRDEIHKIGKELNIDSIKEIENYWDIDHNQAASQIARVLNDQGLLELISRHTPKYVEFGGFQGQFYSMDEKGNVFLASSWDMVKKNVAKVIEKSGDKAYGILKALIDKNGRSSYVELLSEIENIIGWDYTPSSLLSRFIALKLVFKTGSNKYPRWEIPPEIIPVVKTELEKHTLEKIRTSRKIKTNPQRLTEKQEQKLLYRDLKLDEIVSELVERKSEINMIFLNKHRIKLFKDNEKAIMRISKPCSDDDEFSTRINWLSVIVTDDVEIDSAKNILKNSTNVQGPIDFIETYLNENGIKYDEKLVKNLRMLKVLRNKKYPIHPDDGKFLDATTHFGQPKFPIDWTTLWESVLKSVSESFTMIRDCIQSKPSV